MRPTIYVLVVCERRGKWFASVWVNPDSETVTQVRSTDTVSSAVQRWVKAEFDCQAVSITPVHWAGKGTLAVVKITSKASYDIEERRIWSPLDDITGVAQEAVRHARRNAGL